MIATPICSSIEIGAYFGHEQGGYEVCMLQRNELCAVRKQLIYVV